MNGLWSGWYDYGDLREGVSFTAWFNEQGGLLSGSILEPNTFSPSALDDLQSTLSGVRHDNTVSFDKIYMPDQGAHDHIIRYEGTTNHDLTRVKGTWSFRNAWPGRGRFELHRSSQGMTSKIVRRVFADIGGDP